MFLCFSSSRMLTISVLVFVLPATNSAHNNRNLWINSFLSLGRNIADPPWLFISFIASICSSFFGMLSLFESDLYVPLVVFNHPVAFRNSLYCLASSSLNPPGSLSVIRDHRPWVFGNVSSPTFISWGRTEISFTPKYVSLFSCLNVLSLNLSDTVSCLYSRIVLLVALEFFLFDQWTLFVLKLSVKTY